MSNSTKYQKILVIATHCIGDSLLITPFTRSLRQAYPNAQIDVLINERGGMVFNTNTDINHLVDIPPRPKWKDYWRILRQHGRYDLVVNEMTNDRSAIYSFIFGKHRLGVIDPSLPGAWLKKRVYNLSITERPDFEHKMSRAARLLNTISVTIFPQVIAPEAPLPEKLVKTLPQRYVVVHCPSSNEIKQWPVEYWQVVISTLLEKGYYLVLSGAPLERDRLIVQQIVDNLPSSERLISAVGQLSLAQTSTLLKHSAGFVGPDSGPGHMAAGYPIPIISIISVAPASKWSPWPYQMPVNTQKNLYLNRRAEQQQSNVIILQSERQCVPCYKNKCQISDAHYSPCLQDITPDRVIRAVEAAIPLEAVE
ncbi:glycosyltransferase family 9 protein [Vibrio metschnikovii]|uniref:glycosyltransferase family 9 protein n=1 Tax=Vibrio metschnikovii TaxID=28172 RepID=UPI001C2FE0F8|nr:glycosyltransferase family 9 protein [Vibrio metschnikovii]